MADLSGLSQRQSREIDYHRVRARQHVGEAEREVNLTPIVSPHARWWNAYWVVIAKAKALDLANKRALVIGCGFGDDAVHLAAMGASVCAVDISPESIEIARERAKISNVAIWFAVSPAEMLPYPTDSFDLVYLPDVLHHLDIPRALREILRVLKTDGVVLGNEPYTHSLMQGIRNSWLVSRVLYPRMVEKVYGTKAPYITADERKLSERDIADIQRVMRIADRKYFLLVLGRLLPPTGKYIAMIESALFKIPLVGRFIAGRIVFTAVPK